jgi:hypothetical protein
MPRTALPAQYDETGKQICGAKTTRNGGAPCRKAPVRGYNRCHTHRGMQGVVGPANPNYKHGRDSAWAETVPARMRENYAAQHAAMDKLDELTAINHIALIDSRILDLLENVDAGATARLWLDVRQTWQDFKIAQNTGDVPGLHAANAKLDGIINHGASDAAAWEEIGRQVDRALRARDSEVRRRTAGHDMIRLDRLDHIKRQLVEILASEVEDQATLMRIASRIGQVM